LYGTDKPDLRYGMALVDCTELLGSSGARIFRQAVESGGVVKGVRVPGAASLPDTELESLRALSQTLGAQGVVWLRVGETGVEAPVAKYLAPEEQRCLVR